MSAARFLIGMLLAVTAVACGGPTPPPPVDEGRPSVGPSSETSAAPATGTAVATAGASAAPQSTADPGAELLEPVPQPALAGLYLPAGVLAQGTDHYAFIQARTDCAELATVLGAGQWQIIDRAVLAVPSAAPSQPPLPDLSLPEWLLLRWGGETAVARVGGDDGSCVAQVWRAARSSYEISGSIQASGEARELQTLCAAGGGVAQLAAMFFGDDGLYYGLEMTVPLELGNHPIPVESELNVGRPGLGLEDMFPLLYGGDQGGESPDVPEINQYYPSDPASGVGKGTIEVTSVDPLVGEVVFEDARSETDTLTLRTAFRCDLPTGQLTRAAEQAAEATPAPDATPTPAPGEISIEIESGPHAGAHTATSADATCSFNLFGDGGWLATYSAAEPTPGELQLLNLTMPADGDASVLITFGDDFERDWFDTDQAAAVITDDGSTVSFAVSGHTAAGAFSAEFVCNDVTRF